MGRHLFLLWPRRKIRAIFQDLRPTSPTFDQINPPCLIVRFFHALEEFLAVRRRLCRRVRIIGTPILQVQVGYLNISNLIDVSLTSYILPSGPAKCCLHCSNGCGPTWRCRVILLSLVLSMVKQKYFPSFRLWRRIEVVDSSLKRSVESRIE